MARLKRVDIVTLFPSIFQSWLEQGVVSRAIGRGIVDVSLQHLRPYGVGRHRITDDYPFGGGPGMVMKPEPIFAAIESLDRGADVPVILLSPVGRTFTQAEAVHLSRLPRLVLIAGHYEGVDERVRQHLIDDELSIGDFVLSSGELAAMVVVDAVVRLLPGALSEGSASEESFSGGLLEHPQYTRPADFRGWTVPDVLVSGHHEHVARWRREESVLRTAQRRPDLLERADLTIEERLVVAQYQRESEAQADNVT